MKKLFVTIIAVVFVMLPVQVWAAEENVISTEPTSENDQSIWAMDLESLNSRFESVMTRLTEYGYGEQYEMKRPNFEGYSMDSVKLFEENYGDLWEQVQLEEAKLPTDFSARDFLKQGMDARSDLFSDVQSSSLYKTVMNQISVDSVWKQSEKGLPNAASLFTNSFKVDFSSKTQDEKNANKDYIAGIQEGTLDLFTRSGQTLSESNKTSFWNAVQNLKEVLNEGEGSAEDIFEKMK